MVPSKGGQRLHSSKESSVWRADFLQIGELPGVEQGHAVIWIDELATVPQPHREHLSRGTPYDNLATVYLGHCALVPRRSNSCRVTSTLPSGN